MTTIGWYVHHHGAGHLMRMLAIRPHLAADVVVLSSRPAPQILPARTRWIELESDHDVRIDEHGEARDPADAHPTVGGLLHWAPLHHRGHASRLAEIAAVVASEEIDAFVVDVSVEVALLVRLLGVPLIVVTQPGAREDEPHRLAYRAADAVLAPWPHGRGMTLADTTAYEVGGISRFAGRERRRERREGTVLLLVGGEADLGTVLHDAEATTPGWRWDAIGGAGAWVDDPWDALCEAEVVVSAAGQNAIADLAAVRAHAIVIPADRPFGEQRATAAHLDAAGLAVVVDALPAADDWPGLLERARALQPDWERWEIAGAAERAAAVVLTTAARLSPERLR